MGRGENCPISEKVRGLSRFNYSLNSLPDPRTWLREDVQRWIDGLVRIHRLPSVQTDRFLMNGKALCLMTMEMFCQRVPLGGKMLYKDFQIRLSMAMYNSSSSSAREN